MEQIRQRLYESYVSTHAGPSSALASRLTYHRDIRPHLPLSAASARILDIGCGQGALVHLLREDGLDAYGIDISPEQVALARAAGLSQVELGDFFERLGKSEEWDAVVATDLLEHLDKTDVLRAFDRVHDGLRPGGVFVGRVPNAVSPLGGHVMYGDATHETWFTERSVAQLAAAAGFVSVRALPCPPIAHGLMSRLRIAVWKPISGLVKLALAAETGQLRGHVITQNLVFVAHRARVGTTPNDATS